MQRQNSLLRPFLGKQPLETKPVVQAATGPSSRTIRLTSTFLLLALFSFANARRADAALTLTAATGGSAISADAAGGSYTTLIGPKLAEGSKRQIGTGTIILNAPSGFEFNTGAAVTVASTGSIVLSNTTATVTLRTITIGVKTRSWTKSTLTWTGIQIRPTGGTPLARGTITNSGSSSGPAKPGNWGTVTEVAGSATKLAFGTPPGSVSYGQTITPAVKVQLLDQFGNLKTNGTGSVTVAIGNNPASGTLSGTTTVAPSSGVATFSTLSINNAGHGYTLTASASGLTGVTSGLFDIYPYRYAVANGNWNATSTWSGSSGGAPGASVPVAGIAVFIGEAATACTVTIPSGCRAVCGSVTMGNTSGNQPATLNFADSSSSLTVDGNVTMNRPNGGATSTIGLGAGSMTVNGDLELAHHTTSNTGNTLINKITVSTGTLTIGGDLILSGEQVLQSQIVFSGAGTMNLAGAFTLSSGLGSLTPSTGTVNFNGAAAGQTIPIGVSSVIYGNLAINNTSDAGATPSATISGTQVTGHLSVQSGTFNNGGFAITLASGKNFSVASGATFNLTGTSTMASVSGGGTKTLGATSTVNYAGANQAVTAESYGNLTLSGSGTKTMPASTTTVAGNFTMADGSSASATANAAMNISGDFTLGSGTTFNAGSYTHNVGGDWNNNGAAFTAGTSTIILNGTNGAQNIGAASDTAFFNLMVNNSAGVTLGANPTVNGTLTLTSGIITTDSYQVKVGNTSNPAVAGAGSSSYVNGTLQKSFATGSGQSFTFPIGDGTNYCPVALANLNVTTAGTLTAEVTGSASQHPNIATSGLNSSRGVNRYWTLTDDGVLVVNNYSPTFSFGAGDIDGGADATQFVVRQFDGTNWSAPTPLTRTSTSTAATGLSSFGTSGSDFVIGDPQASQMIVTLPNQSFTSGSGNFGAAVAQTAGSSFNLTLSAVDIFNVIDTSYTGTQTISYTGPANAPNGEAPTYTTSISFSSGQATGVATTLRKAETTTLTASDTANSIIGVASSSLTANPSSANKPVFTTQPTSTRAGSTLANVVVQIQDSYGNYVSQSGMPIALTLNGSTLYSGTNPQNTDASGKATFNDLVIRQAGTALNFSAAGGSLIAATSGNFNITPAAASKLVFTTQPAGASYKTAFTTQPVVKTQDAYGNNSTVGLGSSAMVTVSLTTGTGPLVGTTSLDIGTGAGNGTASYAGLKINKAENGDVLTASAPGFTSRASSAFNVDKATLTVTADAKTKTYGDADPALTYQITSGGLASGDSLTGALSRVAGGNAGSYAIQQGTLAASANYALSYVGASLAITPRPITVTAVTSEKPYDGTASSAVLPIVTSGSLVGSDTAAFIQAYNTKDVLTAHTLIPSGSVNDGNGGNNYAVTFVSIHTDSIKPAPLTVMASDVVRVYGAPNPALTASYAGFVHGEDAGVLSGAPSLTTTADTDSPVNGGPYPITVSQNTLTAANYSLGFTNGHLTITPAATTAAVNSDKWTVPPTNSVTFSVAASASAPSTAVPSGTVQFVANGTNNLGSPVPLVNGRAALTVLGSALAHGSNTVIAVFSDANGNFNGSSGELNRRQVVNISPNSGTHGLGSVINTPTSFTVAQLVGMDSDMDNDSLTVSRVSDVGTNGGTISLASGTITYKPPPNYVGKDSFSYTIADPFGGVTNCTLNVTVRLGTSTSAINHVAVLPDGNQKVLAFGMPGKTYLIQATSDMMHWASLTTNTVPANSVITFFDLTATNFPARYYRLVTLQ